jgi:hypothetical protein
MNKPGKTKVRLAKLLTKAMAAHGLEVPDIDPALLMEAKGFWRTSSRGDNDAIRWEVYVPRPGLSVSYHLVSDFTMTELLKADGVILTRRAPLQYWVDPTRKQETA